LQSFPHQNRFRPSTSRRRQKRHCQLQPAAAKCNAVPARPEHRRDCSSGHSKRLHLHAFLAASINPDWISQGAPKTFKRNGHYIAILQRQSILETEYVGTEKVNMHIAGNSVRFDLEVMMFKIRQGMAHPLLTAVKRASPDCFLGALDRCLSAYCPEL